MTTYIALLRGINVGGHNKLPMKELRELMADLGFSDVQTYIQTGNIAFQSDMSDPKAIASQIRSEIKKQFGFEPDVLVLTQDQLRAAIKANPFPQAESEPKTLHLFFLLEKPADPDLDSLEGIKAENERFKLTESVFYLHAPDGIGRSKLAENIGKFIRVSMTARNWRSVQKIMEMADA